MNDVAQQSNGKTVLIVEDDAFILEVIQKKLQAKGYTVVGAGDAHEGLQVLKSQPVHLVLLDILLPGGANGFLFLRDAKKDESLKNIPVVILSNLSEQKDVEQGLSLGAVDFLIKANHTPNEIVDKVEKTLGSVSTS